VKNSNGVIETNVISHENKTLMKEQYNRINALIDYKSDTTSGRSMKNNALNEDKEFKELMDKMRNN
jgi:hypothetical protein